MKISKKIQYALKSMIYLARDRGTGVIQLKDIAAKEQIPVKFLESIMAELKRAGLVESIKGRSGGYQLAHAPEQIPAGAVVRALEGPLSALGSRKELGRLAHTAEQDSVIYELFMEVGDAIASVLDRRTLADLVRRENEIQLERTGGFIMAGI